MAKYKASYKGIGDLLSAKFMQAEMYNRANKVKAVAEAIAPVGDGPDAGEYKASFEVSSGVRTEPTRRAYGRVENTSDHAFYVEYGTKDTPRHRVLGRALEAAGG